MPSGINLSSEEGLLRFTRAPSASTVDFFCATVDVLCLTRVSRRFLRDCVYVAFGVTFLQNVFHKRTRVVTADVPRAVVDGSTSHTDRHRISVPDIAPLLSVRPRRYG